MVSTIVVIGGSVLGADVVGAGVEEVVLGAGVVSATGESVVRGVVVVLAVCVV